MKYYISDLHLFHPAILQKCSRPFATIDDMHRTIFQNWTKKGIGPCDEVYILGDVGMYHEKEIGKFLMALPGKKYLVTGNHDFKNIHNRDFSSAFLWCRPYAEVRDNERKVVLFHYPIEEWNGFYVGSYHLHGHIHNTTVTHIDRRYNVSVDVINYTPVTLDELIAQNDVK